MLIRIGLVLVLGLATVTSGFAQENAPQGVAAPSVSQGLVPFSSDEGLARLSRSDARVNFPALANQFEAEYVGALCGPASAAIVLNAVFGRDKDLPRDRSRFRPDDLKFVPSRIDVSVPRFTQDNVLDKGSKTRAEVFGAPIVIDGKETHDYGFQLRQLDALLCANGAATRLVVVSADRDEAAIRSDLIDSLKRRGEYVIVNYQRKLVGQDGPPHISPLGAYDAGSDSFLVLDVNPSRADWTWVPAATLIKAMGTFDTVENRGYIVVERR